MSAEAMNQVAGGDAQRIEQETERPSNTGASHNDVQMRKIRALLMPWSTDKDESESHLVARVLAAKDAKIERLNMLTHTPIGTTWRETAIARLGIMQDLRAQLEAAQKDTERLDAVEQGDWSISVNDRAGGWIVQRATQAVGNIGSGRTPRAAIDAARLPDSDAQGGTK